MVSLKCGAFALLVNSVLATSCWRGTTCTFPADASFPGPWEANIYAPDTRSPRPKHILSVATLQPVSEFPGKAALQGNGSALVFDFGVEVGGVANVKYTLTGDAVTLGLSFTEAKDYIGYSSDSSNGNYRGPGGSLISQDGPLLVPIKPGAGTYEVPVERLRDGFRYLTLYILTTGSSTFDINDIKLVL